MSIGTPRDVEWDDLEFRAQTDGKDGRCLWVPYLRGTSVIEMLEEWVGSPFLWKDHYQVINLEGTDMVQCWISIRPDMDPDSDWVVKENVGALSTGNNKGNNGKGGFSDAFKRCASRNWGVGRGVYELRPVWAPCDLDSRQKPIQNSKTLPVIRTEYAEKLGIDMKGEGKRTEFSADSAKADDNPFPPEHGKQGGGVAKESPAEPVHTAFRPSKELARFNSNDRPWVIEQLQAWATDQLGGEKGNGFWPIMTPTEAAANQELAREVCSFMAGLETTKPE